MWEGNDWVANKKRKINNYNVSCFYFLMTPPIVMHHPRSPLFNTWNIVADKCILSRKLPKFAKKYIKI